MEHRILLKVVRTAHGRPAVWEAGGSGRNSGQARLVCGPDGEPLRPYYVRRNGNRACGEHALLPVRPGCGVVLARQDNRGYYAQLYRVSEIDQDTLAADCVPHPPSCFDRVLAAALDKACSYHCRAPVYVRAAG